MSTQREYAVKNPYNGAVMEVPDNSLANAQKMAALVGGSLVMTRTVTNWVPDSTVTSDHYVRHLLRGGDWVKTEFECRATEGGACRTVCTLCYEEQRERCECDNLNDEGDSREPVMGDLGACGWLPWFEDAGEECYNGPEDEPVRGPDWQPINILFETHDEVSWEYAK